MHTKSVPPMSYKWSTILGGILRDANNTKMMLQVSCPQLSHKDPEIIRNDQ